MPGRISSQASHRAAQGALIRVHRGQVHSLLLLLLARGAAAAAAVAPAADADADATAGSTCGTTSHPSSVAKKASLRSSMGGADGSASCTSRARAADADADADEAAAAGTARATGRFCTPIPPAALVLVFVLEVPLLPPPRWQVAWWSARFRLGTRWRQSGHVTLMGSSSCCDDRWRVNRGDRRIPPPPPPVVPAEEAGAGALDGSGGFFRLFVFVELMVLM